MSRTPFAIPEATQNHDEVEDKRTSEQTLIDIAEANKIRATAERLDIRGDHATAILFRNAAWLMENGRQWLDDADVREVSR
jgi:hypothetical protein